MMKLRIWPDYELREGPRRTHLSPILGRMMLCLLGNHLVSKDLFSEAMWPDPNDIPEFWADNMKVRLAGLRGHLRPFRLEGDLLERGRLAPQGAGR
jgi:hypothetical protein